jgi:hypothetical protein
MPHGGPYKALDTTAQNTTDADFENRFGFDVTVGSRSKDLTE